MNGNATVIRALFDELDILGVREFCVCAGARNAPIIQALVQRGSLIRNFFDERSAAFFALGRVMQTRTPVAVLTTSGTAVAELFPAIIEAHYQNLPLVAITADRPSRYRGSGAPQAIEQNGLFGDYAGRIELEWLSGNGLVKGRIPGKTKPLHLNVSLEEISESAFETLDSEEQSLPDADNPQEIDDHLVLRKTLDFLEGDGPLVVLASGIHPVRWVAPTEFLLEFKPPVVAEVTSNLWGDPRLGPLLVRGGEKALQQMNATRVLRIGGVPSWRWWRDLESRPEVRVLNISQAPFSGLARTENVTTLSWDTFVDGFPVNHLGPVCDASLLGERNPLDACLARFPNSEAAWVCHLSRVVGENATVFLGNSLPIREWNLAADRPKRGTAFFANRGANGIDGLVSTWLGVSADSKEAWCIVGDLSALYDMNAPWVLSQLPAAKRRIVVINNGGGKIFSRVPWLNQMPPEAKRVMENPHAFSFEPWARMWGMDYRLFTDSRGLSDDDAACCVWEIRPDPAATAAFWSDWRS